MQKVEITKHLKLPFQFDEVKLLKDLEEVFESNWIPHFNKRAYEGNWKSIPLYAPEGDITNIFASNHFDSPNLKPTPILSNCSYIKEVLSRIECPFLTVRLLNLAPGAVIKPHKDFELGYENGCFRLHIPIVTNPQVKFILDDTELPMHPGECWYTNVNYTHSVANHGAIDRIHLVIDGKRNEWSDSLFFSLAPKESLLTPEVQSDDIDTIMRTIEELRRHENSNSEKIIKGLIDQINN